MGICPKSSKQVGGDSKICRDCGAILEDSPDDSVPGNRGYGLPGAEPLAAVGARGPKKPGFFGEAGLLQIPQNTSCCGLGRF